MEEENDTLSVACEVCIPSNDDRSWRFVVGEPEAINENDPMWTRCATPMRLSSSIRMSFNYEEGTFTYEEDTYLPVVGDYWHVGEYSSTPSEVIYISSDDESEESIDFEMKEVDIISISSDSSTDSDFLHSAVNSSRKSESVEESEDIEILPANSNINPSLDHGEGDDEADDEVFSMNMNACIRCAVDLGDMNPRQLCGKTFCYNMSY